MLIPLGVFIGADAPKTLFGGRWNLGRKDADDEWTFVAFLAILKSQVAGRSVDRPCVFSKKINSPRCDQSWLRCHRNLLGVRSVHG